MAQGTSLLQQADNGRMEPLGLQDVMVVTEDSSSRAVDRLVTHEDDKIIDTNPNLLSDDEEHHHRTTSEDNISMDRSVDGEETNSTHSSQNKTTSKDEDQNMIVRGKSIAIAHGPPESLGFTKALDGKEAVMNRKEQKEDKISYSEVKEDSNDTEATTLVTVTTTDTTTDRCTPLTSEPSSTTITPLIINNSSPSNNAKENNNNAASNTRSTRSKTRRSPDALLVNAARANEQQKQPSFAPSTKNSHASSLVTGNHCIIHKPTLEQMQSMNSFGSYIREVVLPAANVYEVDKNHPDYKPDFYTKTPMELTEGLALIRLPKNYGCSRAAVDRTGRGPHWQAGTVLGDWVIDSPIEQHVRGMAGVYEYILVDQPSITMSDFRDKADKYREEQIGHVLRRMKKDKAKDKKVEKTDAEEKEKEKGSTESNDRDEEANQQPSEGDAKNENKPENEEELDIDTLERQFWKRLGPTMSPAWYGADQEDSLFYSEHELDHADPSQSTATATWSLQKLDSCLQVLPPIPGVTSPYLYAGMWASVFAAHTEDMHLLSINYLHAGAPKIWYSVAEPDAARFLSLAQHYYGSAAKQCKEFLRHKRCLLSPAIIHKAGIRYQTAIQYPGDAIITMPGSYHFGFNTGFNVAEATNFGVPEWLPFGRQAKFCLCRPDSVRIDMHRLTILLQKFERDKKRNRRLTFCEWRRKRDWEKKIHGGDAEYALECAHGGNNGRTKRKVRPKGKRLSEQQRKNEFWVEVMKPVASDGKIGFVKQKRKKGNKKRKQGGKGEDIEVWHLAKPINKSSNRLTLQSRVLCIVPATQNLQLNLNAINSAFDEEYDDDEHCFAGTVVDFSDDFARIHLNGLPKSEDIWMPTDSPRLFLDGGQFTEENADLPTLHYWDEMDSKKRLCV